MSLFTMVNKKERTTNANMGEAHPVRWTYILIVSIVAFFAIQNTTSNWIYFTFIPAYASRYPWMYLTSIFLHASLEHVLVNMVVLLIFGTFLERILGSKRFLLIFILAGIIGNIGYQITSIDPTIPSLGASGAIYGVMGALAILDPLQIVYLGFIFPLPIIVIVPAYAILDLLGLFTPDTIAHGAHLGGLVIGVIYGYYYRRKR
jgi:membrane associated rhomboid family serine protease